MVFIYYYYYLLEKLKFYMIIAREVIFPIFLVGGGARAPVPIYDYM